MNEDPSQHQHDPQAPGPVQKGGLALTLYAHSLSMALLVLFVLSFVGHAATGTHHYTEEQCAHGQAPVSLLQYVSTSRFWFEPFQPDTQIRWHDVWLGGCVSAVLFTIGKTAIGYYIGHASVGSAYGAAGSLVVLLVWVYYSSLIFFFGAEFTHAWATHQHAVAPEPYAAPGAAPQQKSAVAG